MKSFKQYLIEGGDTRINDIIFNSSDADVIIPLSQTVWERLTGKKGVKYAIHITSLDGLEDIKRLSGSKKGIPTMTELDDKEIRKFLEKFSLLFFLKQNPAEGGRRKFKEI